MGSMAEPIRAIRMALLQLESKSGVCEAVRVPAAMTRSAMKFDHLKALPTTDRLLAMEALWESFANTPALDIIPDWHRQVLAARLQKLNAGQEASLPWSLAKEKLNQLTRPAH
jgi:hypothetical protein